MTPKDWMLILAWFFAAICSAGLLLSIANGVGAFYHPMADGAHLAGGRATIAMVATAAALALALFFTLTRARHRAGQIAAGVGAVAGLTIGALLAQPLIMPQTERYHFVLNDRSYVIPRHFAPRAAAIEGHTSVIQARVCPGSYQGRYSNACSDADDVLLSLSEHPLTDNAEPRSGLALAGAVVGADGRIVWPEEVDLTPVSGDGLQRLDRAPHHFIVDSDARLIGHAYCSGSGDCRVLMQGGHHVVGFTDPSADNLSRWRETAARVETLFDGWRCEQGSCDTTP